VFLPPFRRIITIISDVKQAYFTGFYLLLSDDADQDFVRYYRTGVYFASRSILSRFIFVRSMIPVFLFNATQAILGAFRKLADYRYCHNQPRNYYRTLGVKKIGRVLSRPKPIHALAIYALTPKIRFCPSITIDVRTLPRVDATTLLFPLADFAGFFVSASKVITNLPFFNSVVMVNP
jgi:hypothetical protein